MTLGTFISSCVTKSSSVSGIELTRKEASAHPAGLVSYHQDLKFYTVKIHGQEGLIGLVDEDNAAETPVPDEVHTDTATRFRLLEELHEDFHGRDLGLVHLLRVGGRCGIMEFHL